MDNWKLPLQQECVDRYEWHSWFGLLFVENRLTAANVQVNLILNH